MAARSFARSVVGMRNLIAAQAVQSAWPTLGNSLTGALVPKGRRLRGHGPPLIPSPCHFVASITSSIQLRPAIVCGEADRRQGRQADVAHFFAALARTECTACMGADGALRLCAEGDPELDEPGRSLVEGAALVAGFRELLMGGMDVREGALETLVDLGADAPSRSPSGGLGA
jgi:hypothetical protein